MTDGWTVMPQLTNRGAFLVVDLECTCWEGVPEEPKETIEIGAVVYVVGQGIVGEFQRFVRPKLHPVLSEFCKRLTTIAQGQVDAAAGFVEVFPDFVAWSRGYPEAVVCSWGHFDDRQLRKDCELHGIAYPFSEHVNLKMEFCRAVGCKPCGMSEALRRAGLDLAGTHHRGIDDARNIARLLEYLIRRQNKYEQRGTDG